MSSNNPYGQEAAEVEQAQGQGQQSLSRQQRRAQERRQAKDRETLNKTLNKLQRLQALQARRQNPNTMQPNSFTRAE
jgi:hypothetical protein